MASIDNYENSQFLFRIQKLIIDGGTQILCNLFSQKLKNVPLSTFLSTEKTTIKDLQAKKILSKAQVDLIYPASGRQATVVDFDITLLTCLLRSIPSLGLRRNFNWHQIPQSNDLSIEADVARLKNFRNEVAHISSTTGFQEANFLTKWTEVEQVLLRLNNSPQPIPNFTNIIDNYKHSSLDPHTESNLQAVITQWQEFDKALETDIKMATEDIKTEFEEVAKGLTSITDQICDLKNHEYHHLGMNTQNMEQAGFQTDVEYKNRIQELQAALVTFYRTRHSYISISPLLHQDTPLLDFYVSPDIVQLKEKRRLGSVQEKRVPIDRFRDMLNGTNNRNNSSIYIIADAGFGKTAYSKRLALAWCETKDPLKNKHEYFTRDECETINGFRFLFLLLLRDSTDECELDDMIMKQIIPQLCISSSLSLKDLECILARERVLVVLDGLDEWTHPGNCTRKQSPIPHRKAREAMTVITTTRPWKLSIARLHSSDVDQRFEIIGLSKRSANKLKGSVISYLSGFDNTDKAHIDIEVQNFNKEVAEKNVSNLEAVPLLLMYLLFLRHYKVEIGNNLTDLYSGILEVLLSRTVDHSEDTGLPHQENIPSWFRKRKYCQRFYSHLVALGRLAFETLLRKTKRENTLVFDSSIAKQILNQRYLDFCLKAGIISQSEIAQTDPLQQESRISFAHKTLQEYFAALYMFNAPNRIELIKKALSNCAYIKDILNMSKMHMFISGMSGEIAAQFSYESIQIINENKYMQAYRMSAQTGQKFKKLLYDLQQMNITCCSEMPPESEIDLCLQDVLIDECCVDEHYLHHLRYLTIRNSENIKSVYIDLYGMKSTPYSCLENIIEYFELDNLEQVEKIHCTNGYMDDAIVPLINKDIKCLSLSCLPPGYWSSELTMKVLSLHRLVFIDIREFKMSHGEFDKLYSYISEMVCMRHIVLAELRCIEHKNACTGPSLLDLSQHTLLNEITLGVIPLSKLRMNVTSLEKCNLFQLSLRDLECHLESQVLPDDYKPRCIELYKVGISMPALEQLIHFVDSFPHRVDVHIKSLPICEFDKERLVTVLKSSSLTEYSEFRDTKGTLYTSFKIEARL